MSYDNIFTHPTSVTIFAPNHCYMINATQGNSVHTLGTLKAKSFLALLAIKLRKKLADLSLCRMVLPVFASEFFQTDLIQLDGMSARVVALGLCVCGA